MLKNNTVAVVVPAYNEENQITGVIDTMPIFVDYIIVVNDNSMDSTAEIVKKAMKKNDMSRNHQLITENSFKEGDKESALFHDSKILINNAGKNRRIVLINLQKNMGVGAAIASGYKWCKDHKIDCTAVMAGDGQMNRK